ncbi:MAG: cytochrome c [Steroidobacteraceae bacterium]
MKLRPTLVALGLGIVLSASAVLASAEGNAKKGADLAYTCLGCHGIPNYKNAYPNYRVPKVGGQHVSYLESALKAYASGERSHPTMYAQATSLSDQDRADIAAYLAAQPLKPAKQVVGTPPAATQVCVACHGPDGVSPTAEYPVIAGQHADYIEHTLRDYKSGKRKNPIMAGIAAGIKDEDIPALAAFFSRQDGVCGMDQVHKAGKCQD